MSADINRNWMDRILSPFLGSIPALSRSIGIDQSYIRRVLAGVKTLSPEFRKHLLRVSFRRQGELNDGILALSDPAPIQYKDAYHRTDVEVTARGFALLFLRHVVLRAGVDIPTSPEQNKYIIQTYIADAFQDIFCSSSDEFLIFSPGGVEFERYFQFGDWEYSLPWPNDIKYSGLFDQVRNEARAVCRTVSGTFGPVDRRMTDEILGLAALEFQQRWLEAAKAQLDSWNYDDTDKKSARDNLNIQIDIMNSSPSDFSLIARTIICAHWILHGEFKWQD